MPLDDYWASGGNDRHYLTLQIGPRDIPASEHVFLARFANPNATEDGLEATLEDGTGVFFRRSGIAFTKASVGEQNRNKKLPIVLDNASLEVSRKFQEWQSFRQIVCIYRVYLRSDLSEPKEGPITTELLNIKIRGSRVTGQCAGFQILRRDFPRLKWTPTNAPSLARR